MRLITHFTSELIFPNSAKNFRIASVKGLIMLRKLKLDGALFKFEAT
jgi:hypothetical protein